MKKLSIYLMLFVVLVASSSCATIFGGRVTAQQRTKPAEGQPSRKVRAVPLIADILLFAPSLIVDFATGAIYKPEPTTQAAKQ